jgi:Tol biopolymer transport system component
VSGRGALGAAASIAALALGASAAAPATSGRIAYIGKWRHLPALYVANADGSGLAPLTRISPFEPSADPSWSPDGKWIAFDGERYKQKGDGSQTFLIRVDGTGERQLTKAPTPEWLPAWSPDGRRILFEHPLGKWGKPDKKGFVYFEGDGRIDLYTIKPDGSGRHKIARVRNERDHCACADWSPDGTKIAYEAAGANGKSDIFVMNADGTGRTQLTTHPGRDENPDWSPDGTQIAFYSERTGNGQIYVMNADGTNQHRVTHDPWYDQAVRWQPIR